jgi:hypothetical protein
MQKNVKAFERAPRIILALATGIMAVLAAKYCVNAFAERDATEEPTWRTVKTWRVEPAPESPSD